MDSGSLAERKGRRFPHASDDTAEAISRLRISTFDGELGHRIIGTHMWAVREGLRGADAYHLFDGYCQRLVVDGFPLWRAHAAMETLHPQWNGYGYTWRRDLNAIEPENYAHGSFEGTDPAQQSAQPFDLDGRGRRAEPLDAPASGERAGRA